MKKEALQERFAGRFDEFYRKYLSKVSQHGGDEYLALCPFHEDRTPSFNFNRKSGQYFCHGCGKKGDWLHFYARAHNLDTRRDFGKVLRGIAKDFGIEVEDVKPRFVNTYDYLDEQGKALFQVCRMEPKTFRQRHRNGNGWTWDLKGVRLVPYRLPEILAASEVIIVEGEKDADNLAALGFTATTSPMGAKKWRDEYSAHLEGKAVVLCPDNDKDGREHMVRVGASINGTARSLKWLEIPGLKNKGDVSDFIATFKEPEAAAERLAVMIEGADNYTPPKVATSIEDAILPAEEFTALELPPKRSFLHPWLTEQSIHLLYGWRGAGKTWLAVSILDAITRGEGFGPWKAGDPVPCLFLDGEMPAGDMQGRMKTLFPDTGRKAPLIIYSDAYAHSLGLPRAHLAKESWREKMKAILLARGVKVWVIDNLASLASGMDENKKLDWDPVNSWLLDLRFAGITTLMLHHEGKTGLQRGTAAREDNIDISMRLKQPPDYIATDGCRFIAHFLKSRVATADLPLIADTEFRLEQDEHGGASWTWKNVRKQTRQTVLELINEGITQTAIADTLGLSRGRVSQVISQAKKDGAIDSKGRLTQSGFSEIFTPED